MNLTDYLRLRAFVADTLGIAGTHPDAAADSARAVELLTAGRGAAETAAAGLLYYAAILRVSDGARQPGEPAPLACHVREHAQTLAAYLPERQSAELLRVVAAALPEPAAAPTGTDSSRWTDERKAEARAMRDKLKAEGRRDYAARTAECFSVTPQRLRVVLGPDESRPRLKPLQGWPQTARKVHRAK